MQGTKSASLRFGLVATLLVSVLAASAPPVTATDAAELTAVADGLVVGAQHSTAQEFNNAAELTNLSVTGSGEGASVVLSGLSTYQIDDFEDGDINIESSAATGWNGDTSQFSASTTAINGTYSGELKSNGGRHQVYYTAENAPTRVKATLNIDHLGSFAADGVHYSVGTSSDDDAVGKVLFEDNSGELQILHGGGIEIVDSWQADTDYAITFLNIDYEQETFEVAINGVSYGPFSFSSSTSSATRTTLDNDVDSSGESRNVYIDDVSMAREVPTATGTYISANHSVTNANDLAANLTLENATAAVAVDEYDGSWSEVNSTTVSTTGNHSLDVGTAASETLRTRIEFQNQTGETVAKLHDETILFTNHKPQAANFDPPDGGQLTERSVDFSVDVSDPEFPTAQGDSVEARLFVDGQQVGAETVTSNQTVSITHTIETGGEHDYYWELEDSYGSVTTTATKTVSAPGEISVYNSSAPTQLVDNAEVEIRVYANETSDAPEVYTRNTTDGTLNMSKLPADKPFVVVAEAENYTTRRIFVPSLYETQSIYLLPDSQEAVSTEFQLEDYTGNYPGENSVLLVQRALNGSYQTVLGDFFGANDQFPAQLQYNIRHRLVIMNVETGQQRVVGTYTPQSPSAQTIAITPSGITSFEEQPASITVQPTTNRLPAVSDANLSVTLDNNSATIGSWNVTAVAANGSTSTTLWTYATQEPGTATQTVDLTGRSKETLLVNVTYVVDGATLTETTRISIDEVYDNDATLLATLTQLADLSAPGTRAEFTGFLSMLVTVFAVAATARIQPSSVISGFTGVMVVAGFSAIGWVGYDVVFVAAVGFVGFTAIERGL